MKFRLRGFRVPAFQTTIRDAPEESERGFTMVPANQTSTAQSLTNGVKHGIQSATEQGEHLIEQFKDVAGDVGERLSRTGRQVTTWTRNNPMQAALVSVGIGFVLGALIRRSMTAPKRESLS